MICLSVCICVCMWKDKALATFMYFWSIFPSRQLWWAASKAPERTVSLSRSFSASCHSPPSLAPSSREVAAALAMDEGRHAKAWRGRERLTHWGDISGVMHHHTMTAAGRQWVTVTEAGLPVYSTFTLASRGKIFSLHHFAQWLANWIIELICVCWFVLQRGKTWDFIHFIVTICIINGLYD